MTTPKSDTEQYKTLGNAILERQSAELQAQLAVFQSALTNFARDHGEQIKNNAQFKQQFIKLCQSIGVDPLSLSNYTPSGVKFTKTSSHDRDEYYNNLAVKVIETCRATRDANGGIISVDELISRLEDATYTPTAKDIEKAVADIKLLDGSFSIFPVKNKLFIKSIPEELNSDQQVIFETCGLMGYVSPGMLRDNYGWGRVRCRDVLEAMVRKGLLWVDEPGPKQEVLYWEPSWINMG
ncbi:hypothetical protein BABINDRAFT_171790 [Babjeviella inositovora NRRL Y-12698]|uniref:Vacuolar-sorting protein SNF8 n=1 Tax=Babjeviella inositovora NRRL Y-12698 TaxID=984486 RepID=A0A1E3QRS5_9ASCO|nr:uncharacterized protein BABINDRAFT_171790 [Babjeviella inositovora NRRL Y-12698]ODQ79647.1 hypothetical protein BABINDRAFT_171790 [Babjeviella inositovora NRRL Y-12698]